MNLPPFPVERLSLKSFRKSGVIIRTPPPFPVENPDDDDFIVYIQYNTIHSKTKNTLNFSTGNVPFVYTCIYN